ncbi:MAG: family transporter [Solirubrobacterales bacterium]|nr:family transporter [Solirubrobacterales bacterium]
MDPRGTTLVVISAGSFALMSILAKDTGTGTAGVSTVLAARFLIAAALFWAVAAARGVRPSLLPRRQALGVLALGGAVYAIESALYFSALTHIDASIASLLLCTYPALVLVFAVLLRRESADARRIGALVLAVGGALLVLAGDAAGALDGAGIALALGSTLGYALYVTLADGVADSLDPITFGALLCTGAGLTLAVGGAATGRLDPAGLGDPTVLADVILMATVSTVLAVTAFFAGMRRIGASGASIIAGIEPFFTVLLAAALLGETLTPTQVLGGLVVLSAVFLVRTPKGGVSLPGDGPSPCPAPAAPARPLALEPA